MSDKGDAQLNAEFGHIEPVFDVPATVEAFRPSVEKAQTARVVTTTTFQLPLMVVFPGPDRAYATRTVVVTVLEGERTGQGTAEALAAPVAMDLDAGVDDPVVQIDGHAEWMLLPDEVAALFIPPIEDDET